MTEDMRNVRYSADLPGHVLRIYEISPGNG